MSGSPIETGAAGHAAPRPAANIHRFPALDGIRGLSAIAILIFHAGILTHFNVLNPLGAATARLSVGVPVFFGLSGFLLYRPFVVWRRSAGAKIDLRRFYRRRMLRILPAYWIVIAVVIVIPGIVNQNAALAPLRSDDLWRYALFLQVYDTHSAAFGLGQAWTLCVEVSFYALLPLLAWLATRARRVGWEICGLAVLAVLSFAVRMVSHASGDILPSVWLAGTFAWLAAGMLLAVLSVEAQRGQLRSAPLLPCWGLASVVFAACALGGLPRDVSAPYNGLQFAGEHLGYTVFTFLLLAPLVVGTTPARVTRILGSAVGRWLGRTSYGIYLWHLIVLFFLLANGASGWWTANPMVLVTALCIVGSVVLGTVSYLVIERPALRLEARRSRPEVPRPPIASPAAAPELAVSD